MPQENTKRISGAEVYSKIREMAIDYDFVPGQTIKESQLAEKMNVSRTPVREALNRLVTEGLITFQKNRGFFCRTITANELFFQAETRLGLELVAVELAVKRADDQALRAISAFWKRVEKRAPKTNSLTMARHDERFHEMIAEASGNPILVDMLSNISARIRFVRRIEVKHAVRAGANFKHHTTIADAMLRRDAAAAKATLIEHLTFTEADSIEVLKLGLEKILNTNLS
ncbi:MAG: GntR family transcriptional regulator [Rhodobacteraceae bacterium]|nr:GntR family transcriptional regulator [Paracoccaceae bacterium]